MRLIRQVRNLFSNFTTRRDSYNALHFHLTPEANTLQVESELAAIIAQRTESTVWVHLQKHHLSFVHRLVNELQFQIHRGFEDKISVCKWLRNGPKKIIPYSRFFLATGAVVINNGKILLVEEKYGARKGQYGIPGGRADQNEDIKSCSQRELWEETQLRAEFSHLSKYTYGSFDLYFACMMKPVENVLGLKECPDEVEKIEWVGLGELRGFMENRSVGTQRFLANYIADLYERGYDFHSKEEHYKRFPYRIKDQGQEKLIVEHFLAKER